ncbi:MAG: protein translocase subunit SecF [Natronospirillum sp.]
MTDNAPAKVYGFMAKGPAAMVLSAVLLVASLGSLVYQGLNLGLDFTGGTLVELGYSEPADLSVLREVLSGEGFDDARVQYFGSEREVMIRLRPDDDPQLGERIVRLISAQTDGEITLRRNEFMGPAAGEELRDRGGLGLIVALAMVMVYVSLRFQYKFAVAAVVSLVHDVVIVVGVFSLFRLNFDLTVLAAVLAVLGYSLNDSIVIADRIRENFRRVRADHSLVYLIDLSLSQTLGRTIVTSGTTLFVLFSLLLFGGEMIRMFSLALIVGVVMGTYSSIFSSYLLLRMNLSRQDMMPPEKKAPGEQEDIPAWLKD